MKSDYLSLLSYEPITLGGVASVKAPLLSEVAKITYPAYMLYLSILLMDISSYYETLDKMQEEYFTGIPENEKELILKIRHDYEALSETEKADVRFFDLIVFDQGIRTTILQALQFFLTDEVAYDAKNQVFGTYNGTLDHDGNKVMTGYIYRDNYYDLVDVILQRNNIERQPSMEHAKYKNKTAEKLFARMKKSIQSQKETQDKKMELANIISALASHHKSINMTNIWDLTVYQLHDQFARQRLEDAHSMHSTSVSVWGDKDNKFDDAKWLINLHNY